MKLRILFTILICLSNCVVFAQNPDGFEKMADRMASKDVPLLTVDELTLSDSIILLDAREKEEFDISHIPGAIWVGYDDFDLKRVEQVNRDKKVIVYCSVGYRSGKVGEELLDAGFKQVYNLYGGMFAFVNNGQTVVGPNGKNTNAVHGYNKNWSKWLNPEVCQPTY
ncbi:unnamed protein product [Chrysoparadoxa australica]